MILMTGVIDNDAERDALLAVYAVQPADMETVRSSLK